MTSESECTADRVLEVLTLFGKVEWARVSVDGSGNQPVLPMVVWRFAESSSGGEDALADLIRARGRSEWRLEFRGRNWVLWPTVLANEFRTGRWRTETEASIWLAARDPDASARLHEEFWSIISNLEDNVQ